TTNSGTQERPLYADIAAGRAVSPLPVSPLVDYEELNLESEEDVTMSEASASVDVTSHGANDATAKAQSDELDDGSEDSIIKKFRSRISMLMEKEQIVSNEIIVAGSNEDMALINSKLQVIQAQIAAYKQSKAASTAVPAKELQNSISAESKKAIPINQIPIFRIASIDDTVIYHRTSDSTRLDNSSLFPSLEAYFNTVESVYTHHIPNIPIDRNWEGILRMSFTPCSDIIFSWYKKNVDARKKELTWQERFDTPVSNFVKGIRVLRMFPNYMDRFTNALDRPVDISDNMFLVIIFINTLPKSLRKFMFDKFNTITGNTSELCDPFPATWKETAVLFHKHKTMLNNELERIYQSYSSKTSYEKSLKQDKKTVFSDKDHLKTGEKDKEEASVHKKRKQPSNDDSYQKRQKHNLNKPNGSLASKWATPEKRNICRYCHKTEFSLSYRDNCVAYLKSPEYRNSLISRGNNRANDSSNNHRNHTPTYNKQNAEYKRVNMLARRQRQYEKERHDDHTSSNEDRHPARSFDEDDLKEFNNELSTIRKQNIN
ncbi:hypothetical protein AB4K20DRAFT_1924839, partial [Rhizopus microsporus]